MTVPSTPRRAGPFVGNLVQTSFPFGFKAFSPGDIAVVKRVGDEETLMTYGVNYAVTLNADQDNFPGGYVLYPIGDDPIDSSESITILSIIPYNQQTSLPTGGKYSAKVVERAFDRIVAQIQQLAEQNSRQVGLPASYVGSAEIKLPFPQAGRLLAWNNGGNGLVNVDADVLVNVAGFSTWHTQKFNGGTDSFTLSSTPGTKENLLVVVDGLVLSDDEYEIIGTELTLSSAAPDGESNVFTRWGEALPTADFRADLVSIDPVGAGLRKTTLDELLLASPSALLAEGLDPTGTNDSSAAVAACLNSFGQCNLPPGVFRLNNVQFKSGQKITGAGAKHKGYYNGVFDAFSGGTTILVSAGQKAFTTGGINCIGAEISGMSIAVLGSNATSAYGADPAFTAGTVGIDETGAKECHFHHLSFFNIEECFQSRSIAGQGVQFTARNHHYAVHSVNDCKHLIHCHDTASGATSGHADLHFYDMNGLIHLGTAFKLIDVDGTTIDNVTIYQCKDRQIEAHGCQFLKVNGTFFENGEGNVLVDDCQNVFLDGTYSRAGWYTNNGASAIFINDCEGVTARGKMERPKGFGINAAGGSNYNFDVEVIDPANGVGSGSAVFLNGVDICRINGTARVLPTSSFAVNATDTCSNISGFVSSDGMTAGPFLDLAASGEIAMRAQKPPSGSSIAASGSLEVVRRSVTVPPGKSIVMNYAMWNLAAGLRLRVNAYFSPAPTSGTDFVGATLHTNGTASAETVDVIAYINNPTGAPISTGASDQFSIKFKVI